LVKIGDFSLKRDFLDVDLWVDVICDQHKIFNRLIYYTNIPGTFGQNCGFLPSLKGDFPEFDHAPERESRFFLITITWAFRK